jgi:uncharacterized protein YggU (UPF0235/DUF167 family)
MYIHIRVLTNQKKELVEKISENKYRVHLRQKAERNMANDRILEIFSQLYKNQKIRIINGAKEPTKLLSIED